MRSIGKDNERFIVDWRISNIGDMETIEDLARYLSKNPRPNYNIASIIRPKSTWVIVWEWNGK